MKMKMSVPVLALVIIFGVGIAAAQVGTPSYLGQTTWSLLITDNTIDPQLIGQTLTLKGGITKVGDNYYLFQGTMLYGSSKSRKVLSGGGVLVGRKLYLSVNESVQFPEDRDVGVMHFILNKGNLNGNVTEIVHSVIPPNPSDPGKNHYFAGTLTRKGKRIPLD